jgi:hypothetical protein
MKVYFSSVTKDPKEHWTELVRRELMNEESNLEKRLIFSGMVSAPAFQPNIVAQPLPGVTLYDGLCLSEFDPEIKWSHEYPEPIGKLKDIFTTDDIGFKCTIEPNNVKTIRKLLGLPEEPLSKVKRRRKTVKKALMAYGKSRDKAEEICWYISGSNGRVTYSDMCGNLIDMLGR